MLTKLINSRFYNFRPVSIPLCGTSWAYSLCPGPSQLGLFNLQRQTSSSWSVCYVAHSQMKIQIVSSLKLSNTASGRVKKLVELTNSKKIEMRINRAVKEKVEYEYTTVYDQRPNHLCCQKVLKHPSKILANFFDSRVRPANQSLIFNIYYIQKPFIFFPKSPSLL